MDELKEKKRKARKKYKDNLKARRLVDPELDRALRNKRPARRKKYAENLKARCQADPELAKKVKTAKSATQKKWLEANPDKKETIREKAKARAEVYKSIIAEFRAKGCSFCAESAPCCLQAHHLNPEEKDFSLSNGRSRTPEKIREELAKCICVCANCHAKIHAGAI